MAEQKQWKQTQQGRVRKLRTKILQHYSPKKTDGRAYRFEVGGKVLETPQYAALLQERYPEDLGDIDPGYLRNCIATVVAEVYGRIRSRNGEEAAAERFTTRHEVEIDRDQVLYVYVRSTDPDPKIVKLVELREQVVFDEAEAREDRNAGRERRTAPEA